MNSKTYNLSIANKNTGEIIEGPIVCAADMARKLDISYDSFISMLSRKKHCNSAFGWHIVGEGQRKKLEKTDKGKKLFDVDLIHIESGQIIYGPFLGAGDIAQTLGIKREQFNRLLNNTFKICHGWKLLQKGPVEFPENYLPIS